LFALSAGQGSADDLPADLGPGLAAAGITAVVVDTDTLPLPREVLTGKGLRFVTAVNHRELYEVPR
jgi:hypothetical protein